MSFFIRNKPKSMAKRAKFSTTKSKKRKIEQLVVSKKKDDEEITSSEDELLGKPQEDEPVSSENEHETAQEKKLRLAKVYLKEIEREERERLQQDEEAVLDDNVLAKRLKKDYLSQIGKLRLTVADTYRRSVDEAEFSLLKSREHCKSLTCLCTSLDDKFVFAGSKDCSVVKYSLESKKSVGTIKFLKLQQGGKVVGHSSKILCMALSSDFKFLVVGDESSNIEVWNPDTLKHIKTLRGHKKPVTGVCFQRETHTLYSCSKDRTAKVWNLDEMSYVETLFGHQDEVLSIDTLYKDRVTTCGGHDIRLFKITEETQLIFNGHSGNIDNIKMINDENFITSGDDGQICVWTFLRKKPLVVISNAHGKNNDQPNWISALGVLVNTDLFASGSCDGFVRLWKLSNNFKTCTRLFTIPIVGFVSCISFSSNGKTILIAAGKEHKLGRWRTIPEAKNGIHVVPLHLNT